MEQVVRARSIRDSTIIQVGGDYRQVLLPSDPVPQKPIYLSYADSDVQALYLRGRLDRVPEYSFALEVALRLLLVFKPCPSPILVAASSVIQSQMTFRLITKYSALLHGSPSHLLILRRESDWGDYFEKRQENTRSLAELARYAGYFDPTVRTTMSAMPAARKSVHSGRSSSALWLESLEGVRQGMQARQLDRLSEEVEQVLATGVFVWETLQPAMLRAGVTLPPWDNGPLALLVDSYLSGFEGSCLFPTGIALPWDPCPRPQSAVYTNLPLLHQLVVRLGCAKKLVHAPVHAFSGFVGHEALFDFRSRLYSAADSQDALRIGLKAGGEFRDALDESLRRHGG